MELLKILKEMFGTVSDFLSSPLGGLWVGGWAADKSFNDWEDFEQQVAASNEEGVKIIRETLGIGSGGDPLDPSSPNFDPDLFDFNQGVTPAANAPQSVKDKYAVWQERGVGGFVVPSAIEGAFETGREARRLGKEYFDPYSAVDRYKEAFAPTVEGLEALPGEVTTANQRVQDLYGRVGGQFRAASADLNRRWGESLQTARGLVSSLGEAERQDINRRFTEAGTEMQMGLSARGQAGGTISSSLGMGVERERSTALLGLNEQMARQRLGVEETFGVGGLSARERLMGAGLNFGVARAGAMQYGNQLYANTAMGALAGRGNIAAGEVGAFDQAAQRRIDNLLRAGGFQVGTQLNAAGMALNWQGPNTLVQPMPNYGPQTYPYGGNF